MKKCSEDGCMNRASFTCKCTSPDLYFCDSHFTKHAKTFGNHVAECLLVEFSPNQVKEMLPKLTNLITYFKLSRKKILNNSKILTECIETETRKALNHIQELEKASFDLISVGCTYKKNYEKIQCITTDNNNYSSDRIENVKITIGRLYESYNDERIWKECDQIIFPRDPAGGFLAIDLNTFKLSTLDYAPKIGQHCYACKVDKNTYFCHGGSISNVSRAESYLVNIKDKNYEVLKNGLKKIHSGGSVLKHDRIYLFGGNTGNSSPTTACSIFGLISKTWKSITELPKASYSITAAILGKNIILSGYHLNCCYSYNDSTFTNILTLTGNLYKIICEGWIYTNSILYKNKDQNRSEWIYYNVNPWNSHLWIYCVFKKNEYIYFIDAGNCLMRIDTILKKVERIPFT